MDRDQNKPRGSEGRHNSGCRPHRPGGEPNPSHQEKDAGQEKEPFAGLFVVLFAVAVGGTLDLILDAPDRWLAFHPIFELLLILAAFATVTGLWLDWWRAERTVADLERSLAARRRERDPAWRENALRALEGFAQAIDGQSHVWGLTPAEREVALLLLKGYSHKRTAKVTDRSERTARQHAVAVYRKAGVSGRAELSAFFLEDLSLPDDGTGEEPGGPGTGGAAETS